MADMTASGWGSLIFPLLGEKRVNCTERIRHNAEVHCYATVSCNLKTNRAPMTLPLAAPPITREKPWSNIALGNAGHLFNMG
jgi:hypothetical protein